MIATSGNTLLCRAMVHYLLVRIGTNFSITVHRCSEHQICIRLNQCREKS
uniref:Uncharacterized protein n=1 Tax=Arundo donax TaxID=35708 RepID=A0A0A9HVN6_ARUDO